MKERKWDYDRIRVVHGSLNKRVQHLLQCRWILRGQDFHQPTTDKRCYERKVGPLQCLPFKTSIFVVHSRRRSCQSIEYGRYDRTECLRKERNNLFLNKKENIYIFTCPRARVSARMYSVNKQ